MPTVPFVLVTVVCSVNSSQKLHDWVIQAKMDNKQGESIVKKGMAVRTKVGIIISVTFLIGFGFTMMLGCAISFILCLAGKRRKRMTR